MFNRIAAGLCLLPSLLLAQAPQGADAEIAALKAAVQASQMAGDNAWMLVSSALVLMMTGPGLALFYCGLVRRKNVLGTMMQSFAMMAVITLVWGVCGYSLVFAHASGNDNPVVQSFLAVAKKAVEGAGR